MDDRRDHFETARDPWDSAAHDRARAQGARVRPHRRVLRECVADARFAQGTTRDARALTETLALMEATSSWTDAMLRLDTATLTRS
jgi:hypothetical protein